MIAKLNSKKDIQVEGISHPPEIHWLTNPDDSLHLHMDTTWACCQNALRMTESLNMGTLSKIGPGTPEAYKQHWPDEDDPSKMPNPLQIGPPTYMMIIMTHILTLMKTSSKEETDETKYVQHLKRSQNNPEAASLSLIHAC